ncbi:MAG: thiamine pyrophosphate-binding protein [Syntrophaceae bacterium]|nr:thiamine pyrophosphate-binding protein [Syntrophaceae bacterium]
MQKDVSGAQLLARCLSSQGIKFFFTVPTPRLKPLLNALGEEKDVRVICAHNETAATQMAEGYIRRSRLQAAALTDANGRAVSQISGVTNAWADKIPLVSLSLCADDEPDYGKGVDRYSYDQRSVFQTVTRCNIRLTTPEKMPEQIVKALKESFNHKMGPVHIDIPFSLLNQTVAKDSVVMPDVHLASRPIMPVRMRGDSVAIERAAKLLMGARKPLVFCGGGVKASDACAELMNFLETFKIPIATSMAGTGCVPISHSLCLGGPSYTSGEVFHVAIKETDVVLALGAAFSGLEGFGLPPLWSGSIQFIHVDIDPLQLGLNIRPAVSIQGDVETVLNQLVEILAKEKFSTPEIWEPWRSKLAGLKKKRRIRLDKDAESGSRLMHQAKFVKEMGPIAARDDLIIVGDGGNTMLYLAMYAPDLKPWQFFFPCGMSALGGGLPYAIGVQLAAPDKRVVLVTGDGSFMYNVQELETVRRLNLPIMIVINNDSAWNMIRALQSSFYACNYVGTDLEGIDYVSIVKGFGIKAERVINVQDLLPLYERARKEGCPMLIDCVTDKDNTPDCLTSFALVEFEGALQYFNPFKFLMSVLMMQKLGFWRNIYQLTYIIKALLRINLRARR